MTNEEVKDIVTQFYERVINHADYAAGAHLVAENFHDHGSPPDTPRGLDGLRNFLSMLSTAFPDIHVAIDDLIAEGDKAAVRLTVSGTHKGMLLGRIPPSGHHAVWQGMDFLMLADGRITDRWGVRDLLGLMQQIGAIKA